MIRSLALCLFALPAVAETPMTAEEFDAYTKGRTLTYLANGVPYGIERYMTGRRVIWSFLDGECRLGSWYQQGAAICFVYDDEPDDPECWELHAEGSQIRGVFVSDGGSTTLYEAQSGDEELICENFGT